MSIADDLSEMWPDDDILQIDGYDSAIIGVGERCGQAPVLVYDGAKIMELLREEMDDDDAHSYYDFNIAGAWLGPTTPMLLTRWTGGDDAHKSEE